MRHSKSAGSDLSDKLDVKGHGEKNLKLALCFLAWPSG